MSHWRTKPVDDFPTPREVVWSAWARHLVDGIGADGIGFDGAGSDHDGLMLDGTPDTDLQALMEAAPGDDLCAR